MSDPESLVSANHHRLFRYFCRAVGSAEAARDLTQEVFLRVSRTGVPSTDGDLSGWLFRIARNLALDYHRARLRHPHASPLIDEPSRSSSQDVGLAVSEALASLQPLDRDVFLMREVAGLGYDEIAAACDMTPDAVRSRIYRARLELRERLAAPIATFHTPGAHRSRRTYEVNEP
jgi:RNA polymerase sigma-70 factor (ECF subfamily)